MSDLISRSKLIEEINELLKSPYANQQQFGAERRETIEIVRDLCVKNQPTAYDIDKVVQGGVTDDVCKWRVIDRPHNLPIYNTSCGKIRLQYSTGIDVYCNGCGKKIKVVG